MELTAVIDMAFNIPVRMSIAGVIVLITSNFHLLETPLWQDRVGGTEITPKQLMTEPQTSSKRMNLVHLALLAQLDIIYNLDNPVVLIVSYSSVAVARNFVVVFGDRSWDRVGVQITSGGDMTQTNNVAIFQEPDGTFGVINRLVPSRKDHPVVVLILVVVASDLLLFGTNGERLYMGVQQTASIPKVFDCYS